MKNENIVHIYGRQKRDVVDMLEQKYARIFIRSFDDRSMNIYVIIGPAPGHDVWKIYDGIYTNPRLKVMQLLGVDIWNEEECKFDWIAN